MYSPARVTLQLAVMLVIGTGCQAPGESPTNVAFTTTQSVTQVEDPQTTSVSSENTNLIFDLDGDGIEDIAELHVDEGLILTVNNTSIIVSTELVAPLPLHTELSLTVLHNGDQPPGLLVSVDWATNKIGSTVELWLYNYKNGKLTLQWDLADEQPEVHTTKISDNTISIRIPKYNLEQNFQISDEDLLRLKSHAADPDDALNQADLIGLGTTTAFRVRDTNGDGRDELVVNRLMHLESPPFYAGSLYTEYQIQDGDLVPSAAILTPAGDSNIADIKFEGI